MGKNWKIRHFYTLLFLLIFINNVSAAWVWKETLPSQEGYIWVGSIKSNKYHNPNCKWAKKIFSKNKAVFSSISEAGKLGYKPCKECKPNVNQLGVITGKVTQVVDGDTIIVKDKKNKEYKIRFFGIDAPEIKCEYISQNQPYGLDSLKLLTKLVDHKTLRLETVATDTYGRIIAKIYLGKIDICLEMVKAGLAWRMSSDHDYKQAQHNAQTQKLGIWADQQPIKPEKWRKLHHL